MTRFSFLTIAMRYFYGYTNQLESLDNIAEKNYLPDIVFPMLVNKDYTQPYDANADTDIYKMCESEGLRLVMSLNCVTVDNPEQ